MNAIAQAQGPCLMAVAEVGMMRGGGKTGLPNAGTSTDSGKTLKRWRKLAGLDDSDDE